MLDNAKFFYRDKSPVDIKKAVEKTFINRVQECKYMKQWKCVRKYSEKRVLVERYVIRQRNSMGFSLDDAVYMIREIMLALIYGDITLSDVQYEDNKIQHINKYDSPLNIRNITKKRAVHRSENVKTNTKMFKSEWKKYASRINNHMRL